MATYVTGATQPPQVAHPMPAAQQSWMVKVTVVMRCEKSALMSVSGSGVYRSLRLVAVEVMRVMRTVVFTQGIRE